MAFLPVPKRDRADALRASSLTHVRRSFSFVLADPCVRRRGRVARCKQFCQLIRGGVMFMHHVEIRILRRTCLFRHFETCGCTGMELPALPGACLRILSEDSRFSPECAGRRMLADQREI